MIDEEDPKQASRFISPKIQEQLVIDIKKKSKPFWERDLKCYISFLYNIERSKYGYDRIEAPREIPKNLVFTESYENKNNKAKSWSNASKCSFIIAPLGFGLDTHRAWEGLMMGSIPIVKKSKLDYLYEDLPVLIVKEWSDINMTFLHDTIHDFKDKHKKGIYNYDKLLLSYWIAKIKNSNH